MEHSHYFGLWCHEKLLAEEARVKYMQLVRLYDRQQNIIIDQNNLIVRLRHARCNDHTLVTYVLPPAPELTDISI